MPSDLEARVRRALNEQTELHPFVPRDPARVRREARRRLVRNGIGLVLVVGLVSAASTAALGSFPAERQLPASPAPTQTVAAPPAGSSTVCHHVFAAEQNDGTLHVVKSAPPGAPAGTWRSGWSVSYDIAKMAALSCRVDRFTAPAAAQRALVAEASPLIHATVVRVGDGGFFRVTGIYRHRVSSVGLWWRHGQTVIGLRFGGMPGAPYTLAYLLPIAKQVEAQAARGLGV